MFSAQIKGAEMLCIFVIHDKSLKVGPPRFGLVATHWVLALSIILLRLCRDSPFHGGKTAVAALSTISSNYKE